MAECVHAEFDAQVDVSRLEDVGRFIETLVVIGRVTQEGGGS